MLKKTITYIDYDGNERTEDFYFNLTKAECYKMEMSTDGGMEKRIRRLIAAQKIPEIVEIFEKIIFQSYGEKSPDGKRFIKSDELSIAFSQTQAYDQLFLSLVGDAEESAKFINAVVPNEKIPTAKPGDNMTVIPTQSVNQ